MKESERRQKMDGNLWVFVLSGKEPLKNFFHIQYSECCAVSELIEEKARRTHKMLILG